MGGQTAVMMDTRTILCNQDTYLLQSVHS